MARRSTNSRNTLSEYKFINVDFSLEDRLHINNWLADRTLNPTDILLEMVEAHFKMSMSWSASDDCFSFTMTESKQKERKAPLMVYYFKHTDFQKGLGVFYWFFIEQLDKGTARYNEGQDDNSW